MLMRKNRLRSDLGTLVLAAVTLVCGCTRARSSTRPDASGVQDASADTAVQDSPDDAPGALDLNAIEDVAVVEPSLDCGQMCMSDLGQSAVDLSTLWDALPVALDLGG